MSISRSQRRGTTTPRTTRSRYVISARWCTRELAMKHILFMLAVLTAAPVYAQQPSVTFMPLAASPQFQNRVVFNIVQTAPLIEVEATAYTPAGGDTHPS